MIITAGLTVGTIVINVVDDNLDEGNVPKELNSSWTDTTGLVGYWKFNGAVGSTATDGTLIADSSGQGYTGTISDGADNSMLYQSSLLNETVMYDGVNDYVDMGDQTAHV